MKNKRCSAEEIRKNLFPAFSLRADHSVCQPDTSLLHCFALHPLDDPRIQTTIKSWFAKNELDIVVTIQQYVPLRRSSHFGRRPRASLSLLSRSIDWSHHVLNPLLPRLP